MAGWLGNCCGGWSGVGAAVGESVVAGKVVAGIAVSSAARPLCPNGCVGVSVSLGLDDDEVAFD